MAALFNIIQRDSWTADRRSFARYAGIAAVALAAALPLVALAETPANQSPQGMVLIDPLGESVTVPTNSVPPQLLPPAHLGQSAQIPEPTRGASMPESVLQRQNESRASRKEFTFFPSYQPPLMPYLASQDQHGNTAIKPGSLLPASPLDTAVQQAKYRASELGYTYSFQQTLTWVSMTDVLKGANNIGYYTLSWKSKWAVFDAPDAGAAGWLSAKINAKSGLGADGNTQSAARNLGSVADPTGIWSSVNGIRVPELAWQQSLADGKLVAVAGMVNQSDYFDANSYANNGRGQFLNSALINSMVMPLPGYNFGLNLQWQPVREWYAMIGSSFGNAHAGQAPWTDFSWDTWNLLGEFGYAPRNCLGLGPGVYRVQPFVGRPQASGTEAGFALNFQQQLGNHAPFGWYGRFGCGGNERFQNELERPGTGAQVGTGFIMRGPFKHVGLVPSRANDAAGIGFVWSHPSTSSKPLHTDEYAVELGYVLQLTPTAKIQPDLQVVWNRAHNADSDAALVFQLQLDLAW
jgi:porin